MPRLKPKPKVFISSTSDDLRPHRLRAAEQLRAAKIDVTVMDDYTATAGTPTDVSLSMLDGCNLLILLVAFRRGTVPAGETRSITQMEYDYAVRRNVPVLVFLLAEGEPWRADHDERQTDAGAGRWRAELQASNVCKFFRVDPAVLDVVSAVTAHEWSWLHRLLTVVIPTRNKPADLAATLGRLDETFGGQGLRTLVVDDRSSDDARTEVAREAGRYVGVRVLQNRYPELQKMGAVRTGAEEATTDFVLVLDDDTVVEEADGKLEKLVLDLAHAREPVDACALKVLPAQPGGFRDRFQQVEYAVATDGVRNLLGAVACISGAAAVWRRSTLVELLSEHSGRFEGDDLELTLLAHEKGKRVIWRGDVVARTLAPGTWWGLLQQRLRWDWGFLRLLRERRFRRGVFSRPTPVGAIFRALALADVMMHPFKLLALAYPFLLFFLITDPGIGIPLVRPVMFVLVAVFGAAFLAGIPSSMYLRDVRRRRLKYALLWMVYIGSPYIAFLATQCLMSRLTAYSQANLQPVVEDTALAVPALQELLASIAPALGALAAMSLLWWAPQVYFLLRLSGYTRIRGVGIVTLLLIPFYFLFHLVVVRTSALLASIFLGRGAFPRARTAMVASASVLLLCVAAVPVLVGWRLWNATADDASDFLVARMKTAGPDSVLVESYPRWKPQYWVYDGGLAAICLTSSNDLAGARRVLEGLRSLQNADGSWCFVYDLKTREACDEKRDVASNACIVTAASCYQARTGDRRFLDMTRRCLSWLRSGVIGVSSGDRTYLAMQGAAGPGDSSRRGEPDTKATLAAYAACRYYEEVTGDGSYSSLQARLLQFITDVAWNDERGVFTESGSSGTSRAPSVVLQTYGVLALGGDGPDGRKFSRALDWCEQELPIDVQLPVRGGGSVGVSGMQFSQDKPNLLYVEGTLQVAAAYYAVGRPDPARKWMHQCQKLRSRDGGVFYCVGGRDDDFHRRPAVSTTCWYRLNGLPVPVNPLRPTKAVPAAPARPAGD